MLRTLVHAVTTGVQVGSQDSECWASEWVVLFWVWATLHCLIDSPLSHSQSQHSLAQAQGRRRRTNIDKLTSLTHCHSQTILLWTNFDDLAFRWGVFMRQVVVFRSYMTKQIATLLPANTLNMLNSWSSSCRLLHQSVHNYVTSCEKPRPPVVEKNIRLVGFYPQISQNC